MRILPRYPTRALCQRLCRHIFVGCLTDTLRIRNNQHGYRFEFCTSHPDSSTVWTQSARYLSFTPLTQSWIVFILEYFVLPVFGCNSAFRDCLRLVGNDSVRTGRNLTLVLRWGVRSVLEAAMNNWTGHPVRGSWSFSFKRYVKLNDLRYTPVT